jgi:hypothetical protein
MKLCRLVEKGLYFECQQCGQCCSQQTDGYIFVYRQDIEKMAVALDLTLPELAERYLATFNYEFILWDENLEDSGNSLIIPTLIINSELNNDCIFLKFDNGLAKCVLYESRPLQCELFPFWSMIMTNEENFKANSKTCVGFKVKNQDNLEHKKFSQQFIREQIKRERALEREFCLEMDANKYELFKMYPFLAEVKKLTHIKRKDEE